MGGIRTYMDFTGQAIANILVGLSNMNVTWYDLPEEVKIVLLRAVEERIFQFNEQELCNTIYSNNAHFTLEEESQLTVYFEWIETLPSTVQRNLLKAINIVELPVLSISDETSPSKTHSMFTETLQTVWGKLLNERRRSGGITTKEYEKLMEIQFLNEYNGLRRNVFPMDIAVTIDSVKNERGKKVLMFIEIDSAFHKHSYDEKDDRIILDTRDQLKEHLYNYHYKKVPILRVDVRDVSAQTQKCVWYVIQALDSLIKSK
eukprot:gene6734-7256_t